MFWAGRDSIEEVRALGVRCGQLGVPGEMPLSAALASQWKASLAKEGLRIATVFAAYEGEDYADIPTVRRTVGFVPPETRDARERRTCEAIDFAARLGVAGFACHIGCIPEDLGDPDSSAVRDLVRRISDRCAAHGQTFALETGQEPAEALLRFISGVDRANLGINFDPANMILYGTGEPLEALRALAPRVLSVHCKDAVRPLKNKPEALGTECPLGRGEVGIQGFVRTLAACGYRGQLHVEREGVDHAKWLREVADAIALLRQTVDSLPPQ
jgi:sugar phosphate isomerase/epimerase